MCDMKLIEDKVPRFLRDSGKREYAGKIRNFAIYECPYCFSEYETLKFNVLGKNKKTCGCVTNELKKHTTHNLSKTKLYKVWSSMKDRCSNKNNVGYKNYGGRGIRVYDDWITDFISFKEWAIKNGYTENLTIDRINNDGNYEPNNCRWVTPKIQSMNKRYKPSNSGYLGVVKNKNNRFVSSVSINNKTINIGSFDTAKEGALARDLYLVQNNLQHKMNFNLKDKKCYQQ